ncbi:TPA: hypothetical protein ACS26H_005293, partial [Serratia marcescens]
CLPTASTTVPSGIGPPLTTFSNFLKFFAPAAMAEITRFFPLLLRHRFFVFFGKLFHHWADNA